MQQNRLKKKIKKKAAEFRHLACVAFLFLRGKVFGKKNVLPTAPHAPPSKKTIKLCLFFKPKNLLQKER